MANASKAALGLISIAAAICLGSPVAPLAQGQGLTADRLYQLCHDRTSADWNGPGQWVCPSYIRGIIDGARLQAFHVTGSAETYKSVMQFCEPPGTPMDRAIEVVVRFIEAQPESRPLSAAAAVYEAFAAEWPCPR